MAGYHGHQSPYQSASQLQRQMQDPRNARNSMMGMMTPNQMNQLNPALEGAQSLEDVVSQNSKEIRRRRSMPGPGFGTDNDPTNALRRSTMMEFHGGSPAGPLDDFQFDPSADPTLDTSMPDLTTMGDLSRNGSLSLNTGYPNPQAFSSLMQGRNSSYNSPLQGGPNLDDLGSPYLNQRIPMSMDMNMVTNGFNALDVFSGRAFDSPVVDSPMHASFPDVSVPQGYDPGGGLLRQQDGGRSSAQSTSTPDFRANSSGGRTGGSLPSQQTSMSNQLAMNSGASKMTSEQQGSQMPTSGYVPTQSQPGPQASDGMEMIGGFKLPWTTPIGGWPSTMYGRPHMSTEFRDVYAPSGFDLLNVLMRVASRPNPEINIGAVDLSCAFVVCDARQHDNPIKYCSESFERLTGYSKHEITGQNCRFLQSPDGRVEPGRKRVYCDDDAVLYLKNCINGRGEAQISLINYRKGGQPFMNLLTMIPILDADGETDWFVGFQVDLVERPNAINCRNPDGSYSVNYQRQADMPGYQIPQPDPSFMAEFGQTVPRDEVSAMLSQIGSADSDFSKRVMDKVLLENSDDVIHVLSLKGLFLYLSPSCRKVLEYEPSELVGAALSSVCHPSDIVPVTRDLKEGAAGSSVSVVFRIRRKRSGYMWFESHGSLHTEQGKGRKCIILVGRERPVYTLSKTSIFNNSAEGIGEHEMWSKMSTNGMFLFVSSNVRSLLDRQPEDLVGTNIQGLMRADSRIEFERVLSLALSGRQAAVKHEMTNRKGQVIQAFSWIYPGDATEGSKPTFLITQTRLIKYHRGNQRPVPAIKHEASGSSLGSAQMDMMGGMASVSTTPSHFNDPNTYMTTTGHAITHAGQNSLAIGRQDASLASEDNMFEELKTTRSTSWQFELRQMEKKNRLLAEEVQALVSAKKKRKRRRGAGLLQRDCANCHTKHTPEWRRGPSGNRDLCNSCGLRWAKQNGRVSPRTNSQHSVHSNASDKASKASASPRSERVPNIDGQGSSLTPKHHNTIPSAMAPTEKRSLPMDSSTENDSHAAKAARTEAAQSQGYQTGGGIPEKIDEVQEPDSG